MPDRKPRPKPAPGPDAAADDDGGLASAGPSHETASLHQAIQQQIAEVLANSGLSEEEKQQILVAMQCPCCGAGGLSLSIKLPPGRKTPSF